MKKILILHNRYQNIGGEDIAVDHEIELLKNHYEVETIFFDNKITNYFSQLVYFLLNKNSKSTKSLEKKILEFKPDTVYIHNTWFKASLGIFDLLRNLEIPTVIKIHNFRYYCTRSFLSKTHLDNNDFCPACGYKNRSNKKFNRYFEESFIKSIFVIIYGKKYFKLLESKKFKLLVLTDFHKHFIKKLGDFSNNVFVQPNPIMLPSVENSAEEKNYFIYAGRISKEKGVDKLVESFISANLSNTFLKIVGEGPLLNDLIRKYKHKESIEFLGLLPNEKVLSLISESIAVITATRLYEGQPTFLCEASLLGVPSVFPKTGGIDEFFPNNYMLSFKQFDYEDLKNKLQLLDSNDIRKEIGRENKEFIFKYLDEDKLIDRFNVILDE